MINVLHIISNGIKRDGITNTFMELISNIDDENLRIDIAAVHNDDIDVIREIEESGCKVIKLPDRQSNILKYCLELFILLRKGKYQAIHVHGSSSLLFIDLFIAKCAGVKKRIAHSRNTTNHYKKLDKLIRPLFHMTYTKALACGKDAGEFLFGNRKFTVIYNGKDFEKFKYDQERRLLVRSNLMVGNSILLGFVGSLNDQKNPLFLIDILSYLVKEDVDVKLIIIGDGSRRQEVEKYSEELDVFEHVIFAGRVSNVDRLLHAVDIMLLPSLYEGLPNVVLEWQLAGIPSLVSNKVTEECKVCPLVQFLSIDGGVMPWVEAIKNINLDESRVVRSLRGRQAMKKAGFDIKDTSSILSKIYLEDE